LPEATERKKDLIASRLREARRLSGLSQGQVAQMMSWHRPTVSQIEAGDRNVSAEEIARLADIFEVGVDWLLAQETEDADPRMLLAARELSKLKSEDLDSLLLVLTALRRKEEV